MSVRIRVGSRDHKENRDHKESRDLPKVCSEESKHLARPTRTRSRSALRGHCSASSDTEDDEQKDGENERRIRLSSYWKYCSFRFYFKEKI